MNTFVKLLCLVSLMALHVSCKAAESDIDCSSPEKSQFENIVCEYPLVAGRYSKMLEQQKILALQGLLTKDEITQWSSAKEACNSVACLDRFFDDWAKIWKEKNPSNQNRLTEGDALPPRNRWRKKIARESTSLDLTCDSTSATVKDK